MAGSRWTELSLQLRARGSDSSDALLERAAARRSERKERREGVVRNAKPALGKVFRDPKRMQLDTTIDPRAALAGCILLATLLLALLACRGFHRYRGVFVANVGASLRQNFIVANPQFLFVASILLTMLLSSVGCLAIGPVGLVGGALLGVAGPRLAAAHLARRRVKRFVYQLPDALLALASALRAGSNLSKGLELLATRQPPPLSQEFTVVLAEHRIGRQLADSLTEMRQRIDTAEVDLMSTAINVSRRVGGNLADTLEALAKTLQEKAQIEGKIDALTSMGRAQGWVVGLLPIFIGFMLYQQQPERMSLLFTQWYGWIVLAVVAAMLTIAVWMIRKIVNIDV
jgi:tight adherence protein B